MVGKKVIFKENRIELVLPVTPEQYEIEESMNVEIVNLHEVGDYPVVGFPSSIPYEVACLLPNRDYSFARDSGAEPYIEQFRTWKDEKTIVRYIVGGTNTNLPVQIDGFRMGENDGTGDINFFVTIRYKPALEVVRIKSATAAKARAPVDEEKSVSNYTIVKNDTLSDICWRFYGTAAQSHWSALARYNGISNPHLIYPGNVLKIPKPLFPVKL